MTSIKFENPVPPEQINNTHKEALSLDSEAEERVKKGEALTHTEAVDDIVSNRDKKLLNLVNQSADNILERMALPDKKLITRHEEFALDSLANFVVLKSKFEVAKDSGDFSAFPGHIRVGFDDKDGEVLSFLKQFEAPMVDIDGQSEKIFICISPSRKHLEHEEELEALKKKTWSENVENIFINDATDATRGGGLFDGRKLLLGDKEELKRFIKACLEKRKHTVTDAGERGKVIVSLKNDCITILDKKLKFDGMLFAARSGIHYGYVLKGFFDVLKTKYPDIQEPYMVGMWHHLANFNRKFGRSVNLVRIFEKYPTYSEFEQSNDSKLYAPEVGVNYPTTIYDQEMPEAELETLKKDWGKFIYATLEETKKQLRDISRSEGKKLIRVAYFDESRSEGHTANAMLSILRSASNQLKNEGITVEFDQAPTVLMGFPGGGYDTWDQDYDGERHNERIKWGAHKTVRPLKNSSYRHALHRLQIEVAKETGFIEAEYLLESDSNDEATLKNKNKLQEIIDKYRAD